MAAKRRQGFLFYAQCANIHSKDVTGDGPVSQLVCEAVVDLYITSHHP